ncbi:MAG: transglycosylase SLT domain-containing protein [Gemmatimonadaceae bacterium]
MPLPSLLCLLLAAGACDAPRAEPAHRSGGPPATRPALATDSVALHPADSTLRAAADAINAGHPYRATQLLAPALADSSRRTPEALYLAAAAAAGWQGWGEVERLVGAVPWADTRFGGAARVLAVRAALGLRRDSLALDRARAAVAVPAADAERGRRLVYLARAFDRLDQRDSAEVAYARAATLVPEIADWLRLRAAGVAADPAARERYYAGVASPVARARVRWTDASARERSRDFAGAARLYDSLGARPTAFRLLLVAAGPDSARRDSVRRDLVAFIRARAGTSDARTAVEVLDRAFPASLSAEEELAVARSAAVSGPANRAVAAFERATRARLALSAEDRFAYAASLDRAGLERDAAAAYARVTAPARLAAAAAYLRGRALLSADDLAGARRALRDAAARFPRDTSAANALALLADLATDDRRDAEARALYLRAARELPAARVAPRARFRAGIIALASGDARAALADFDALRTRWPSSDETIAAGYWAGRALAAAGDGAAARERWRAVAAREPLSYYAAAAARRLGETPWAPPAAPEGAGGAGAVARVAAVDAAMARGALLEALGLDVEARFEYDAVARDAAAAGGADRLLAAGQAFLDAGQPSRAIALGWRAVESGAARDARAYRLAYPVLERTLIDREATARGLDPAFVAALIRQESSFNPGATSPAGARGLMQVMPAVGAAIARARRLAPWDPILLYQPDVNVELGTAHLDNFLRQFTGPERALAAYNAGNSRVAAWTRKPGTDDPELFVERIPFVETRDYVRIVLRNRDMYRALYEW